MSGYAIANLTYMTTRVYGNTLNLVPFGSDHVDFFLVLICG